MKELQSCPDTPNCVCSFDNGKKSFIEPISTTLTLDEIKALILSQRRVMLVNGSKSYLHFVFTSFLFRFKDDVELLLDSKSNLLHVRSASRVGHRDLGVNRKRVEKLRRMLS